MLYLVSTPVHLASAVSVALGSVLVLCSCFLHENQEKRLENLLSEFWIRIDDYRLVAGSKHLGFMQGVADLTARALTRVFGGKLISSQLFVVSFCFSVASNFIVLFALYFILTGKASSVDASISLGAASIVAALFIYYGIAVPTFRSRSVSMLPVVLLLGPWMIIMLLSLIPGGSTSNGDWILVHMIWGIGVGTLLGILCDILYIGLLRKTMRWLKSESSPIRMVLAISLVTIGGLTFAVGPLLVLLNTSVMSIPLVFTSLIFAAGSNALIALTSSIYVVLAGLLLVHRILWPLVERPVYALARWGTFRNRKAMFLLGIICVTAPFPTVAIKVIKFFKTWL